MYKLFVQDFEFCHLQLQQGSHSTADICRRKKENRKSKKSTKKKKCILDPQGLTQHPAQQLCVFNQTATETGSFHYFPNGQLQIHSRRTKAAQELTYGQSWITWNSCGFTLHSFKSSELYQPWLQLDLQQFKSSLPGAGSMALVL